MTCVTKTMSDGRRLESNLCSHLYTTPSWESKTSDLHKLVTSLKLRKACELYGIRNECLRHLLRRPLVHLTHLFNHCLRLFHLPKPWKEAKVITSLKQSKEPNFPENLRSISLLSTTGKLFEKVILEILQRHTEKIDLLNESQFAFRTRHSSTLLYMRHTDQVSLNFNNSMSTAAVFMDIEETFHKIWHFGLLYKLSTLQFSIS
jgi:hypothetical protein